MISLHSNGLGCISVKVALESVLVVPLALMSD